MDEEEDQLSLSFRIVPSTRHPAVDLSVHLSHGETRHVKGKSNLRPLAAVMTRFKIEAMRQSRISTIYINASHFDGEKKIFRSAWHLIKNMMRDVPVVRAGSHINQLQTWLSATQDKGQELIAIDTSHIKPRNVYLGIVDRWGGSREPTSESQLLTVFNFLTGRCSGEEVISEMNASTPPPDTFKFGGLCTKTTVVHRFADGLPPDSIRCALAGNRFQIPPEIEALVDRAHQTLRIDAGSVRRVDDQPMLAPSRIEVSMPELDSGSEQVSISLIDSSYRYYAAFAFAELLTNQSRDFQPLLDFARQSGSNGQPAPATCSLGVRVLVETADERFLVAHRSDRVKLNPNVWSVSANEGVRGSLLQPGRDCSDLLTRAVHKALLKELKLRPEECSDPLLLSIYRNEFNQWGAGFWIRTERMPDEIIKRQISSDHAFEHRKLASIPTDIRSCGLAMRDLGTRWYGGALETLCQVLVWRELARNRYLSPEEIGESLSKAAGGLIRPVDEANPVLLPD